MMSGRTSISVAVTLMTEERTTFLRLLCSSFGTFRGFDILASETVIESD